MIARLNRSICTISACIGTVRSIHIPALDKDNALIFKVFFDFLSNYNTWGRTLVTIIYSR